MSRNLVRLAIAILGCTSIIFLCFRGFVLSHETIQIQEAKSVLEECHEAYLDYIMSNNINANEYPEINDFFQTPIFLSILSSKNENWNSIFHKVSWKSCKTSSVLAQVEFSDFCLIMDRGGAMYINRKRSGRIPEGDENTCR